MSAIHEFWETQIITRQGSEKVIYDLRDRYEIKITLPTGSKWSSGLHWHERHTEYLRVVKGSIRVTLNGRVFYVHARGEDLDGSPSRSSTVKITRGARHEWSRADGGDDKDAVEVVVVETTDPADGEKNMFFWHVNAVILDGVEIMKRSTGSSLSIAEWIMWIRLMLVFYRFDNFPVFWSSPPYRIRSTSLSRYFEFLSCQIVFWMVVWISKLSGIEIQDRQHVPAMKVS